MNKVEINLTDEKPKSADCYISSLQQKVENLREVFFSFLKTFPEPLNAIAFEHYNDRINHASDNIMLGEFAPFLLGEMLSLSPEVVEKTSFSWLLLYAHSLLLDDLLDKTRSNEKNEILVSHMLLERSLNSYKKIFGSSEFISESYEAFRSESIVGMLHEINWSSNTEMTPNSKTNLISGRKAALVKFCASSMMYLDNQRALTPIEEKGLDHLCSGIQLLDDATDVIEDHTEGRINILLWSTYTWIRENVFSQIEDYDVRTIGINQLIVSLICSGSLINSWETAATELTNSINLLSDQPNETTSFINQIISKCKKSISIIDEILIDNPNLKGDLMEILENGEIDTVIDLDSKHINEPWHMISNILKRGPKACQ